MSEEQRRRTPRYMFIASAELLEPKTDVRIATRVSELSIYGCYMDMLNPFPVDTPGAGEDFGRRRGFPVQSQDHLCASKFWSRNIIPGARAEVCGGSEGLDRGSRERSRSLAGIIRPYWYRSKIAGRRLLSRQHSVSRECLRRSSVLNGGIITNPPKVSLYSGVRTFHFSGCCSAM